jgi:hypothetical protein
VKVKRAHTTDFREQDHLFDLNVGASISQEKEKAVYPAHGFEWSREVGLSFPLNDIMMNRMMMEETRWGAVSPGSEWLISTLRADFVSFTSKFVLISPNLLDVLIKYGEDSLLSTPSGHFGQTTDILGKRPFLGKAGGILFSTEAFIFEMIRTTSPSASGEAHDEVSGHVSFDSS